MPDMTEDDQAREIAELRARVDRLERRLDLALEATGFHAPEDGLGQVDELIRKGKTIQAVKAYRELTGAKLREAKLAVDKRAAAGA